MVGLFEGYIGVGLRFFLGYRIRLVKGWGLGVSG